MRAAEAISLLLLSTLLACPGSPGADGGDTGNDEATGSTSSESGNGDGDGDGDGDGEPTCSPSLAGIYPTGFDVITEVGFVPGIDSLFGELEDLCDPAQVDFEINDPLIWSDEQVELIVYRPAEVGTQDWPDSPLPLVLHHHGQQHDGAQYEHLAEAVVNDGAVFVSIGGAELEEPDSRAMIDICMLRWLTTQEDWDGIGPGEGGASRLDGNFIVMGHSNGGEAAHIVYNWFEERPWSEDDEAPEQDFNLCGVIGLAPLGTQPGFAPFASAPSVDGPPSVPYLTVEGSLDNDVGGGSLYNSSLSAPDDTPDPTDPSVVRVWVYDADHDSFGGTQGSQGFEVASSRGTVLGVSVDNQRARGQFIASLWTDAFVRRFLFGDLDVEPLLYGEVPLQDVTFNGMQAQESWWNYHPAWDGEPLVLVSSRPHQSNAPGEFGIRLLVDTMQGEAEECEGLQQIPNGAGVSSEGLPFFASGWPVNSLSQDCAAQLALYSKGRGTYRTRALRADFGAPGEGDPGTRTLAWDVRELNLEQATTFSFRAANVEQVVNPMPPVNCAPVDGDPADVVDFRIVFATSDGREVSVLVSDFATPGLISQDVFPVGLPAPLQASLICPVSHFLQSVRIPLEAVCDEFSPGEIREVRFEFEPSLPLNDQSVLLDTLEFHQDPENDSVCG